MKSCLNAQPPRYRLLHLYQVGSMPNCPEEVIVAGLQRMDGWVWQLSLEASPLGLNVPPSSRAAGYGAAF